MKWVDIRNALNKIISEKLKVNPYSEDIDNIKKPSFYIDLVSYKKEFNSEYRELSIFQRPMESLLILKY